MDRAVLHCDMNNFYASVECLHNPSLRGKPVAVGGDEDARHGIVLAKNYEAKKYGIKTGEALWEARKKCPNLITVKARHDVYLRFSKMAREIYERYTDKIESFGIDECWLDITGCENYLKKTAAEVADDIRETIKFELGVTVSVGVSWNKIFAKLGSDLKKPDATTVITRDNYKQKIFTLPAEDLLYVGRQTQKKLNAVGIKTIGDIAMADRKALTNMLGVWGEQLWNSANGYDTSPVNANGAEAMVKSVGNSTTCRRDLNNENEVRMMIMVMAESVAARLREQWLKGRVISVYIRDKHLVTWGKQHKINEPTFISSEIVDTAMKLFAQHYDFKEPIRSVGVTVSDLSSADEVRQTSLFESEAERQKAEKLELLVDDLRRRFGHRVISKGLLLADKALTNLNPKVDLINPFNGKL